MTITDSCMSPTPVVARAPRSQRLVATVGRLYCRLFHNSISRPVAGKYRCWKCMREFELEW